MQIARPAAPGADRELACQMCLGAGRERCNLFMPYVDPRDLVLATDGVGQTVKAVSNDAVDPLDASRSEDFSELICDSSHDLLPGPSA